MGASTRALKSIQQWLQNRFESNKENVASDSLTRAGKMPGALTPTTVPDFEIPKIKGSYTIVKTNLSQSFDDDLVLNLISANEAEPTGKPKKPCRKVNSLPNALSDMVMELESTDQLYEPGYEAAVSLPHLRGWTPYGFPTVTEKPHTNRQESLFIGSESAESIKLFNEIRKRRQREISDCRKHSGRRMMCGVRTRLSDSAIIKRSSYSSLFSSSLPSESLSSRMYLRRRSSLSSVLSDGDELSQDNFIYLSKEEAQEVAQLGELKLSFWYNRHTSQLHVKIIKLENLMSQSKDTECNPYVKGQLEPGKVQKQQTEIVRGNRNPHFNTDFIYKNVSREDLRKKSIRLRVFNRVGSAVSLYNKKFAIAEVLLPLNQLGLEFGEEVRLWRELDPINDSHPLGYLNVTLSLHEKEGQLSVSVLEATNLSLTSSPDSYVKVIVTQYGRPDVRKQTQVHKNSSNPTYNETFVFSVSTNQVDLESICIYFKVMHKELIKSDTMIGEVVLGTESPCLHDSVESFWGDLLASPTKCLTQWMKIVPQL